MRKCENLKIPTKVGTSCANEIQGPRYFIRFRKIENAEHKALSHYRIIKLAN
jgi:hypothetical protein